VEDEAIRAALAEMQAAAPGLSVGTDLVEIDRIAGVIARHGPRFLRRVYTERELASCDALARDGRVRVESLAARWAAKEAVAKALGTGIGRAAFREIEVLQDCDGCPSLQLHGGAAQVAADKGLSQWALSLAHDGGLALAFVVARE
jgi:holo-[acyl-carrier protein] synthase